MREFLLLLALASVSFGWQYDGLRVKFGNSSALVDQDYFFAIPRIAPEAEKAKWILTPQPEVYVKDALKMYCAPGRLVCALYGNGTQGFVAGLQISVPVESIDASLEPEKYFKKWEASADGAEPAQKFWTATQYYVSKEKLNKNDFPTKEKNTTLQDTGVWVQELNGTGFMKIDVSEAEINKTDFKKQNCIPNMGTHYYWKMSKELTCENQMLPWFPLVKDGKLLGVGFQTFGKKPTPDAAKNQKVFYETLPTDRNAPLDAIPLAPECFLDYSQKYGRLSMHIYFIETPWEIDCKPEDSIPKPPKPNSAFLSRPAALGQILLGALYLIFRSNA